MSRGLRDVAGPVPEHVQPGRRLGAIRPLSRPRVSQIPRTVDPVPQFRQRGRPGRRVRNRNVHGNQNRGRGC
jgi:hypothetical protein